MRIEKVSTNDAGELLALYAPYVINTAISFEYEIPTKEEFEARIQQISSKYPYLKAVENGEIVGYAYANTFKARAAYDYSVETTIYLKEGFKGKGIGKALYDSLEKSLTHMGILNMNACIAITDEEDEYLTNASKYFHEKMGFKEVGCFYKSGYKFNRWYNMIWMEKILGEHPKKPEPVKFGEWEI